MTVEYESAHALTGAYVLDALEADELPAFERHLAACADCREEVVSLRSAVVRLGASVPAAPPPELRDSVLAAIAGVRPLPPLPEQLPDAPAPPAPGSAAPTEPVDPRPSAPADLAAARGRRADRSRRWRLVAAAAAVVALLAVGWGLVRPPAADLGREVADIARPGEQQLQELLSASDLQVFATDEGATVRGTVLRSESLDLAAMLLQGLPGLDDDQAFQAWMIQEATPVDAGVFAGTDGAATVILEGDVVAADAVAVTIEPSGGSGEPTGEVILQVGVSA